MEIDNNIITNILNIKFDDGTTLSVTEEFLKQLRVINSLSLPLPSPAQNIDWSKKWKEFNKDDSSINCCRLNRLISDYRSLINGSALNYYYQSIEDKINLEMISKIINNEVNMNMMQSIACIKIRIMNSIRLELERGEEDSNSKIV